MKHFLFSLLTIVILLSNSAYAQKSEIYDQLNKSIKKAESAKKHAIAAMDYIKQSRQATFARNQFYFYAERAFGENSDAIDETENTRTFLLNAKSKTEEIKCFDASYKASGASSTYMDAKDELREAFNDLKTVKTTEDKNEALNRIASAKSSIEEAIKFLDLALKDLKESLEIIEKFKIPD